MILAVPIGFALGIAGFVSLEMIVPTSLIQAIMGKVMHETYSSILLLTIPMFILMAEFLSCGGVATDLLLACNRALRKVRGGLAMACIAAGAIHAAATGSSTASAASLARASFPAMKLAGYSPGFSVGTISIAGTLALMIPPSVAFVIFGIITETSIGRLFLAGIIPGNMTALSYVLTISLTLKLKPNWGPSDADAERAAGEQRGGRVWPMFALIVIVLGGLYSGIATPTEIGAFGALVISFLTRRLNWQNFTHPIGATLRITSMIMFIIIAAHVFGYFISFTKITDALLAWIAESGMTPFQAVLFVVLIYLILGMFIDQAAVLILTAPISTPLMMGLGYDPVWWGVVMIKTVEIGLVTPPRGWWCSSLPRQQKRILNQASRA